MCMWCTNGAKKASRSEGPGLGAVYSPKRWEEDAVEGVKVVERPMQLVGVVFLDGLSE